MDAETRKSIEDYYASAIEKDRLDSEYFMLEGMRTKEVISRYLKPNTRIADIGGGAGYYSLWLASMGHDVQFVDLSEKNVLLISDAARTRRIQISGITQANATHLPFDNNVFDVVLMLGPLYHLIDRNDRLKALSEARRILKPNGLLISATISRYASLIDGYQRDLVKDPEFVKILAQDLSSGIHINHTGNPEYFTTAYFHSTSEIKEEVRESGLTLEKLVALEGFGVLITDIKHKLSDESYKLNLFQRLEALESNEDLIALSPHMLCIARK